MKKSTLCGVVLATSLIGVPVHAEGDLAASRQQDVNASAVDVWAAIGEFCTIQDWHPAIVDCEVSNQDDGMIRILTLEDGGKITDKLTSTDNSDTGYTYQLLDSPLPIINYNGAFSVSDSEQGANVEWSATFKADGVSDEEAITLLESIFQAGLDSIQQQFQ